MASNIFHVNTASISSGWHTGSFKGDGSQLNNITRPADWLAISKKIL
jgi:hypothetical protein